MDAFSAIADPIRRDILDLLRLGPCEAGAIATRFPVSRPAISRHLRVLREAGLVNSELDGRRRIYRINPEPLHAVDAWLVPHRTPVSPVPLAANAETWASRFDALATETFRTGRERARVAPEPTPKEKERA
ncbi:MAG: metalloregulator ArsR/SmtB family transcription factor [Thermomicrobiales bacterium]